MSEVLHDRVNVRDIRPMIDRDYTVRGCTALLDAIGGAIHHIGNVHKYARPEDVPEHTMFVITTDGMEMPAAVTTAKSEADDRAAESKIRVGVFVPWCQY